MKKFLRAVLSAALIFFVTVSMIPTAFAAGSYTITFSAGDKGTLKQALYDSYAASYSVTRTASGNIKIVVPAGSNMPDLPTAADVDLGSNTAKYYVSSGWEPKEATVTKNATYVVSYGAIVNGVEYTVRYVDAATGNDVASPVIATGNVGDTMNFTAKNVGGYTYNGYSKSMVLSSDSKGNVLTFNYTVSGTPAPAPTPAPTTPTAPAATTTTPEAPAAQAPAADANAGDTINDNNVPLANGEETVEDNQTPSSNWTENTAANTWKIVGGVAGAALMAAVILFAVKKKAKGNK